MKYLAICFLFFLSACDDDRAIRPKDQVILIRDGQMKVSGISKYGRYCWVAWYDGIDHMILKSDGTASDPPFFYRWEPLKLSERESRDAVYQRNDCHEPSP